MRGLAADNGIERLLAVRRNTGSFSLVPGPPTENLHVAFPPRTTPMSRGSIRPRPTPATAETAPPGNARGTTPVTTPLRPRSRRQEHRTRQPPPRGSLGSPRGGLNTVAFRGPASDDLVRLRRRRAPEVSRLRESWLLAIAGPDSHSVPTHVSAPGGGAIVLRLLKKPAQISPSTSTSVARPALAGSIGLS